MRNGFVGTFTPRLDDKGRLTLPAKYRENFLAGAMVTTGQDNCLYVFTLDGFDDFSQAAYDADPTDEQARGFQRFLFGSSDEQHPDGQGRISINARLREYAGLDRDVAVIGVGRRMEIWDAARWERYQDGQAASFSSPAKGVLGR